MSCKVRLRSSTKSVYQKSKEMKGMHVVCAWLVFLLAVEAAAQEGLVAHWSFDELNGEVFMDHAALENSGVNQGGVAIEGMKGKALYLDGMNDYAVIRSREARPPSALENLGEGTIAFWFRVDRIPLSHGIAPLFYYGNTTACDFFDAANEGLIIEVGHSPVHFRSERLYFTMWKNGCTYPSFCFDSSEPISTGAWHHVAVVVSENANTGYLDGREMVHRNYNFGNASYSQFFEDAMKHETLWFGKGHWDRTEQYLEGAMDEVMIFDRPLNAGEVQALYADTTGTSTGIPGERKDAAMHLHPNPVGAVLTVEGAEAPILGIYAANGTLLMEQEAGWERTHIDLAHLPAGLYVLRSGEQRKKFLVKR